jgi:subtilisin family serine protease
MKKTNEMPDQPERGDARRALRSKRRMRGAVLAALSLFACNSEPGLDEQVQKEGGIQVEQPKAGGPAAPGSDKDASKVAPQAPDAARAADGRRRVWVMMRQHAPLASVAAKKPWKQRGADVHKSLRDTAKSSQASLIGWLQQNKIEHQAFWAVNTIQVTADDATIQKIQGRSDVERVINGFRANLPKPDPKAQQAIIQEVEWNIQQVRAPEAWADFGVRGEDVVVGTIDTGVEYSHPALLNSYRGLAGDGTLDHSYNWHDPSSICGSPSTVPCDNAGHGTHTMGTIAGDDAGEAQIGVAPGVKWMTAKGCEEWWCSDTALLSSAQWMLAPTDLNGQNPDPSKRPHIVSNSWGGGGGNTWHQEMVQAWVAAGIFPVFSNGNSGSYCGSSGSPGDYPESYSVGAYDSADQIAYFSSRGESYFGVTKPNISAPGVAVRSSVPGGGYEWYDGTSMAAPHVAGAVALLWSAAPALTGDIAYTRTVLDESAIDHEDLSCGGTPENNNVWGEGSLDVYAALEMAPIGPTGTLVGSVAALDGASIAGAPV